MFVLLCKTGIGQQVLTVQFEIWSYFHISLMRIIITFGIALPFMHLFSKEDTSLDNLSIWD